MTYLTQPKLAVYGVGGVARAGKNLFVSLLKETLAQRGLRAASLAFATELKLEVDPMLRERYGISAFTQDTAEKAVIRHELVAHGKRRRDESGGRYWVDRVADKLPMLAGYYDAVIIEDVRYATSATDEVAWIKSLGGKLIYVGRRDAHNELVPAANDEERANDPAVRAASDSEVYWPTIELNSQGINHLRGYVHSAWVRATI